MRRLRIVLVEGLLGNGLVRVGPGQGIAQLVHGLELLEAIMFDDDAYDKHVLADHMGHGVRFLKEKPREFPKLCFQISATEVEKKLESIVECLERVTNNLVNAQIQSSLP